MGGYNANEQSTFESTTSYEILPGVIVEVDLSTRNGGAALNAQSLTDAMTDADWLTLQRRLGLSGRQRQIVRLIVERELNLGEVAGEFGVKPRTVQTHIERLYAKLGVRGRSGMLCCVYEGIARIVIDKQLRRRKPL